MPNLRKIEIDADRLRKQNNALLVLVIKPDWGYISTDSKLAPKDAVETLQNEIPRIAEYLKNKGAR